MFIALELGNPEISVEEEISDVEARVIFVCEQADMLALRITVGGDHEPCNALAILNCRPQLMPCQAARCMKALASAMDARFSVVRPTIDTKAMIIKRAICVLGVRQRLLCLGGKAIWVIFVCHSAPSVKVRFCCVNFYYPDIKTKVKQKKD